MMKAWKLPLPLVLLFLGGCASEVVRYPVSLSAADRQSSRQYVVLQSASIRFDSGYERTLSAGTELVEVGTIKQGRVLRPVSTVFTIEGAHTHEAYPVVSDGRLVGFYLPVEGAFSPLSLSISLPIQERRP